MSAPRARTTQRRELHVSGSHRKCLGGGNLLGRGGGDAWRAGRRGVLLVVHPVFAGCDPLKASRILRKRWSCVSICASMSKPVSSGGFKGFCVERSSPPWPSERRGSVQSPVGASRRRMPQGTPTQASPCRRSGERVIAGLPSIHPAFPGTQARQYMNAGQRHSHSRPSDGHAQQRRPARSSRGLPTGPVHAAALVAAGSSSRHGVPSRSIACITRSR